jgi:uncharacterized protein YcbK (DUF882 family)
MSVQSIVIPGKTNPVRIAQNIDGSRFFTWGEALHELTRVPENWKVTSQIIKAAQALEFYRNFFDVPFVVQSWYRTPEINAAVGGVPDSRHLFGDGVDWHPAGGDIEWQFDYLDMTWPGGLGFYGDWFHIDLGNYARWRG